jgi:hypothetical protein
MLTLGDMVSAHTRRNLVQDMITGGERRTRWSLEDGEKALAEIDAQRLLIDLERRVSSAAPGAIPLDNSLSSLLSVPSASLLHTVGVCMDVEKEEEEARKRKLRRHGTSMRVEQARALCKFNTLREERVVLRQRRKTFRKVLRSYSWPI